MKCAVLKRGPLTEWWTLLLSRASDKRLVRNLDCVHHCRNRFDHGCILHLVLFLEGVVELQRKNRCFDAGLVTGLVSFGAVWPTTIRLWYCCEKHFHSLDRSAVIGLITALAAARLGLWSADHDLRLGYEPINLDLDIHIRGWVRHPPTCNERLSFHPYLARLFFVVQLKRRSINPSEEKGQRSPKLVWISGSETLFFQLPTPVAME